MLARRKWLILSAMLAAAAITFVLIGQKPERYKASTIVSTGIVNYKGIGSDGKDAFVQQFQVENAFSNLIEFVKSRAAIKLLTIEMLRHDLSARSGQGPEKPFRQPNTGAAHYTEESANFVLAALSKINLDSLSDLTLDPDLEYKVEQIARAYRYDNDALLSGLTVRRKETTDYLTIDLWSEQPALSQFMANTFSTRLLTYYHNLAVREKRKNVAFYTQLAAQKKVVVDSIKNALFSYLYQRGLPNLGKQSEELVSQISQLEVTKQEAESKLKSSSESVGRLQKYIDDRSSTDAGDTRNRVADKSLAQEKSERVRQLTQKSLETGGKDEEVETQLAEARRDYEKAVKGSARSLGKLKTGDDAVKKTKENLYQQKVDADMERIAAEKSVSDLSRRISMLTSKLSTYVANDEVASTLGADQKRAEEEFASVNEQLIKAKLEYENTENPLHIVDNARLPEWPEPNRQMLLSVFAAIVVGSLIVLILLLLAYFDQTLHSPDLFKKYSNNLPLLGPVAAVPVKNLDLNRVFSSNGAVPQYNAFREHLRKIRSGIMLSGDHIFLMVSTKAKEGKTFTMHGLAYSLAANNKRVLMIDTNFKMPLPSPYTDAPTPNYAALNKTIRDNGLSDIFLEKKKNTEKPADEHLVDILGNSGLLRSPAELIKPEQMRQFLADLREHYDYIFLEAAPLNEYSDAHELIPFVDKAIAVFNAGSSITPADKESLDYLKSIGNKLAGAVLTEVDAKAAV